MRSRKGKAGMEGQIAESDSSDTDETDDNHPIKKFKAEIDGQQPTEPASESLPESGVGDDAADKQTKQESSESSDSDITIDETDDDDDDTSARQLDRLEFSIAEAVSDNHENSLKMHINLVGQLTLCICAMIQRSTELRSKSAISDLSIYGWHMQNALKMMELTDRITSANVSVRLALGQRYRHTETFSGIRHSFTQQWLNENLRDSSDDSVRLFDRTGVACINELLRHSQVSSGDRWTVHNHSVQAHVYRMARRFLPILTNLPSDMLNFLYPRNV